MSRSRKRHRTEKRDASDSARAAGIPLPLRRQRSRRIRAYFLHGLALTAIIIPAFLLAERIPQVHAAVEISYDWLQSHLTVAKGVRASVVFIDISDLPLLPDPGHPEREPHTSRAALRSIVEAVLAHEQKPKAIGIDVDFSLAKDGEFFSPDDRAFLEFLLGQEAMHGRLFVGVADGLQRGPSRALGDPRFKELATSVVVPKEEGFGANPWMSAVTNIPFIEPPNPAIQYWPVPSLSAAMTGIETEPPRPLQWALESWVVKEVGDAEGKVAIEQFLVDFGAIDDFNEHAIVSADPELLKRDRRLGELAGKVVIIGRGSNGKFPATDTFSVPGRHGEDGGDYAGVLLHASGAYTLLGATLWRPTLPGRLTADALFSVAVFGSVSLIALYYNNRARDDVAMHSLTKLMTWIAVPVVVLVGLSLAIWTRIMWADHILVAAGLLLHSSLEQSDNPLRVAGRGVLRGWQTVALERRDEEHH